MESLDNIIKKKHAYARYIKEEINHTCTSFKKRAPGEEGEKETANYMAHILRSFCGRIEVKNETFKLHPKAFYGWIYIVVTLTLLAMISYFLLPLISLILLSLALFIFFFEFVLYKEVIDIFFPKKESVNVTAIKKCDKETKCRILFNGHIDAAWNWRVNNRFGGKVYLTHIVFAFTGLIALFILSLVATIIMKTNSFIIDNNMPLFYVGIGVVILFIVPIIGLYFMVDWKHTVDGANDNLTGCYLSIALLKALHDENINFKHVEIGVILTGSEEAGLRGAKAWCKKHQSDYFDVPTYIYSFDTIHDLKYLGVNYRDLNATVKSDKQAIEAFQTAALDLNIKCHKTKVPLFGGSTDSAAFQKAGFKACGITALNHVIENYYHTLKDTPDNINEECLAETFAIANQLIKNLTKKYQ